ncbi:hypothetical protein AAU57_09350 [Nonlabens sp. YIK11]|uniref:hypothetical protein n=1 Tax=Nonlabens sp. YIK11 TaxID=1453349 RepID=UPI0006DCCCC5|nr:hypothetical protein [Nonlabens sp. YIK11]KQC33496.1 hypothetical protein AAU57_09350 [Nonlabens sp. YIK11]
MKLITIISDLKEGELFWRIARTDTFVDLLMLQYHNVAKYGLNSENACIIIQTAIKAITNFELGIVKIKSNYNKTIQEISGDRKTINFKIESIIQKVILESKLKETTTPFQILQYFKVLSNLDLGNYEVDIFYDILISVINSEIIQTDANNI